MHGACSDASSWNKVTARLRDLGFRVRAPQIPLTSLGDGVAALTRLLRQVEGPVLMEINQHPCSNASASP